MSSDLAMPAWVSYAYNIVAWVGAFAAVAVGHMTRHDIVNTMDAPPHQWVRLIIFLTIATALGISTLIPFSPAVMLALVSMGVCALLHNVMVLFQRRPPRSPVGYVKARSGSSKSMPPPLPREGAKVYAVRK